MNATNILNLYKTWYKDVDMTIEPWYDLYSLTVNDKRTGCTYHILAMDEMFRVFRAIGETRKVCGVL